MVDLNLTTSVITLGVNDLNNEEENIVIFDKKNMEPYPAWKKHVIIYGHK